MDDPTIGLSVRFWGVRGSIPTPFAGNMEHGGNTACLEVRYQGGSPLILDAGTGIRRLGQQLLNGNSRKSHLLLTHFHWDHIQGLPFFDPLYRIEQDLDVWSSIPAEQLRSTLERQMSIPYFPVNLTEPPRRPGYAQIPSGGLTLEGIRVQPVALHHPGGATGYKLSAGGVTVIYATDHEAGDESHDRVLIEAAGGADVLIIDSQYTPEEYPSRQGWGHGTWLQSTKLARRAGVKQLVLFHHDPARDDEAVRQLVDLARGEFAATVAAREGDEITL